MNPVKPNNNLEKTPKKPNLILAAMRRRGGRGGGGATWLGFDSTEGKRAARSVDTEAERGVRELIRGYEGL